MSLFDTVTDEDVLKELMDVEVTTLTPLDALNTLYRLQNKLKNSTNPDEIAIIKDDIKALNQAISNANDRMTELSDLQDMARRQCDLLLDEYGENALSEKEIIDILLTDKGQRSDIPYLDVDGDLNKIQLEKFTASQDNGFVHDVYDWFFEYRERERQYWSFSCFTSFHWKTGNHNYL